MADFKKMFGRYLWIIAATTLLGSGGLFGYLKLMGLEPTCEDKVCEAFEECIIPCEVYNPRSGRFGSIYVFNEEDFKLSFTPDIPKADLYVKYYGKWRYTNFTRQTRFGNIPDDKKYVFVFPSKTTKYFQVRVTLNSTQRIKWDFGPLDPVIIGWKTTYENLSRQKEVYHYVVKTVPSKYNKNGTWSKAYNYTEREYTEIITEYYPGERDGVKVGEKEYDKKHYVCGNKLIEHKFDPGDRNIKEFCNCRPYEISKGVCKESDLI